MSVTMKQQFIKTVKKDLFIIGFFLALCMGLMLLNFYYLAVKDNQDKQAIAIAGEMRILSQSIAKHAVNAAGGVAESFDLLRQRRDDFDSGLLTLQQGDLAQSMPASSQWIQLHQLATVEQTWKTTKEHVDKILGRQTLLEVLHTMALEMQQQMPAIMEDYQQVTALLLEQQASQAQIKIALKQSLLSQSIAQHVTKILSGKAEMVEAADAFAKDALLFVKLHRALESGSKLLAIEKVSDKNTKALLETIYGRFEQVHANIDKIKAATAEFAIVHHSAFEIYLSSQALLDQSNQLVTAYAKLSESRIIGAPTGYMLGVACLLLFLWLVYRSMAQAKKRLEHTNAQHKANRAAVWRLLDELANLADGDLTIKASVGQDMTGAIAESVNYAIDALRKLVSTINETAVLVSSSAQEAQTTATHLAQASESQAREIVGATAAINAMTHSIESVSENANTSAKVAKESVDIAKSGVDVVHNTMAGMEKIREQIQGTSKQVKQLGESTQEIGHIVALINDMADQTHVLALNASIQAAMAGEAGRGFAVVAEEVQHLAQKATAATKQIESLVFTIQGDTKETVKSMEQTTQEVVKGAKLSQEAGVALAQIEHVSLKLAELIHTISTEASIQADTSNSVSQTMEVIKDIANQTATGTSVTAHSIGNLAELAIELRESVAGFKLPVDDEYDGFERTG